MMPRLAALWLGAMLVVLAPGARPQPPVQQLGSPGTAPASRSSAYAFTVGSCKPHIAIGTAGQCSAFTGPMTAGAENEVYVTALSASGLPTPPSTHTSTTVSLRFALSCDVPNTSAGTTGLYGGISLPACSQGHDFPATTDSAWSQPAAITFPVNTASAMPGKGMFSYNDVGKIVLNLIDGTSGKAGATASATLVSRPLSIDFEIQRNSDAVGNPAATPGDARGFVRAGEEFTLRVGARTATGSFAPNFHLEANIAQVGNQNAGVALLTGDFQPLNKGVRVGTNFVWDDVGVVEIVPTLRPNDYLGTGPVTLNPQKVGHFYPAYFKTTTESNFACLAAMACPAGIAGAAYSREKFKVQVAAFSTRDSLLVNYKGALARDITLTAVEQPGGAIKSPGAGILSGALLRAVDATAGLELLPDYQLPVPFDAAVPRAAWGEPATIYLRATANESVAFPNETRTVAITSNRALNLPSVEGGMHIVNGRLQLSNAFGSELLRLPVPVNAQYWTGSAWANNSGDNKSTIQFFIQYTGCAKKLALAGRQPPDNCNLNLLKPQSPALVLKDGAGKLWLGATGTGNLGSAWLQIKDTFPLWLPSTRARVVFGVHRSPLIYVREVY